MRPSVSAKILTVASGLFLREGIRTVGVDRIILEAAIAKATFYRHFPSKEDLVLAYLGDRHARVMDNLADVLATFDAPRAQIAEIFDRLREKAEDPTFRGCAFALAVAEHGESPRIVALARLHKTAVSDLLAGITNRARLDDPDRVARHLALLYDGALAKRAVHGDAAPMRDAGDAALLLFDMARRVEPARVN